MPGPGGYESGPGGGRGSFWDWLSRRAPPVEVDPHGTVTVRGPLTEKAVNEIVRASIAAHEKRMKAMG